MAEKISEKEEIPTDDDSCSEDEETSEEEKRFRRDLIYEDGHKSQKEIDAEMGIVKSSYDDRIYDGSLLDEDYCLVYPDSPDKVEPVPRVVRDGKVAVIFQPNHGGGWYFEHKSKALLFDPEIVSMIERDAAPPLEVYKHCKSQEAHNLAEYKKWNPEIPESDDMSYDSRIRWVNVNSCRGLAFRWVPVSSEFRIHEYEGKETVVLKSEDDWITA